MASIISTAHNSSVGRLDRGISRSSSFKCSSYVSERSDSHFSETMGSILGYIDDPDVINLESTKMATPVTCVGSQFLLLSDTLFSYGGGEKASSTYYTYTGYGSVLNVGSIRGSPMTMHAAVAYGIYYLCHGGCSDLRTFRKTLLSPHKMMIINSVTLSAYKKKISGDVPSARLSHKMYLIKPHTVFLAGGLGASGFCKDCFFINLLTMKSVYAGDLPLPLGNFSIVECNSQVYLIGGQTDGSIVFPVFYKISFTDKREQTDRTDAGPPFNTADGTPPTSDAHAAANNRETKTPFYTNNWREYKTEKAREQTSDSPPVHVSFEKLPDPPFLPRRGHTCVSIGKYILLFGGTTGTRYFNDFWLYDSVSMQWREINIYGDPPSKRYGAMMGFLDTSIIVAGGSNGIMQLHDAFYINATDLINQKA
ncbi:Putative Kelch domain protein [Giardia duodenalis]|uniref:Putative Kelch domain protein n=1 Tax=Giardia intestinalis TaxID=5741 RepID=V6TIT0_GIAIN|nr:Putative Kelch domain protein [Giardia intestinalis]